MAKETDGPIRFSFPLLLLLLSPIPPAPLYLFLSNLLQLPVTVLMFFSNTVYRWVSGLLVYILTFLIFWWRSVWFKRPLVCIMDNRSYDACDDGKRDKG